MPSASSSAIVRAMTKTRKTQADPVTPPEADPVPTGTTEADPVPTGTTEADPLDPGGHVRVTKAVGKRR